MIRALAAALLLLSSAIAPAGLAILRVSPDGLLLGNAEPGVLEPGGDYSGSIRVRVHGAGDVPAVVGEIKVGTDTLLFSPAFPFSPRVDYQVEIDHPRLGKATYRFKMAPPADSSPPAEVVAVYPSGDVLPQNQLKFYIHFSRPMSRGEAYEHIRLFDGEGKVVADPFLELAEELWDAENKRLTVFLDPARVKRGLKPHLEAGPPLLAERSYRLEIAASWKDAERRPLAKAFHKKFRTVAPDHVQPDPAGWELELPKAGTRHPLVVTFDAALDHGLLGRLLEVREKEGAGPLAGEMAITDHETRWVFVPAEPWREGGYGLLAGSELEDLAGNSIAKPFEVTEANPGRAFVGPTVSRSFAISP